MPLPSTNTVPTPVIGAAAMVTPPAAVVEGLEAAVVGDDDVVFFFDELPQAATVNAMTAAKVALASHRRDFWGDVITCRSYERQPTRDFLSRIRRSCVLPNDDETVGNMATADDVRRIALSLPETDEHPSYQGRPSFRVRKKGFASLHDDGETCGIWMGSVEEKEALVASNGRKFYSTPHHDGYPTVLVRYAEVDVDELRELVTESWRLKAPKRVLTAFDAQEVSDG